MNNKYSKWMANSFGIVLLLFMMFTIVNTISAAPSGPVITFNNTQNVTPEPATQITTAGGSFTTLVLNATTQTPRWKAYVGNVTGTLVLDDANYRSIFDWSLSSVTGEIYATRSSTTIDWSSIACADRTAISSEDTTLNMSVENADTINKTFVNTIHKQFYVGAKLIQNSTCPAIATYINDTAQTPSEDASFQEIVLKDTSNAIIFTTLITQNTTGFDTNNYDFQMILPEDEYKATPSTYYLYVELV
jgi:hypothetical protein